MKKTTLFLFGFILLLTACEKEPSEPNTQNNNYANKITYDLNGVTYTKPAYCTVSQTVITVYDTLSGSGLVHILHIDPYLTPSTSLPITIDSSMTDGDCTFSIGYDNLFPDTVFRNAVYTLNSMDLTNELVNIDFYANGAYSYTPDTVIELPSLQITNGNIEITEKWQ